jgi:PAS domain S-box-containing protein
MAVATLDGVLVDVNRALAEMLVFSREELVGRELAALVDPVESDAVRIRMRDLAEGQVVSNRSHRRLLRKVGDSVVADIQSRVVLDANQKPSMILIAVEDVTEKIRLEVQLRHAQKLESIGRLAAGIAHEINTPIQFVGDNVAFLSGAFEQLIALCDVYRGLCEKAERAPLSAAEIAFKGKNEEAADLDYIRRNVPASIASTIDGVGRVAKIVKSMKAFAHPDRGERSIADINTALRDTLTVATAELKYVATVETEWGDIVPVPCYLSDLNQVFLNLLVNAAHAIADVVGDSGQLGTIRVRTYMQEDKVVVAISDSGTGIPPAIRSRVFDPFFTTKGVGKGTGQGLAMARSVVVDQHGGTITFDTEMGKGTTFYVRIPATVKKETGEPSEGSL